MDVDLKTLWDGGQTVDHGVANSQVKGSVTSSRFTFTFDVSLPVVNFKLWVKGLALGANTGEDSCWSAVEVPLEVERMSFHSDFAAA